jgi:hypothetical protein
MGKLETPTFMGVPMKHVSLITVSPYDTPKWPGLTSAKLTFQNSALILVSTMPQRLWLLCRSKPTSAETRVDTNGG